MKRGGTVRQQVGYWPGNYENLFSIPTLKAREKILASSLHSIHRRLCVCLWHACGKTAVGIQVWMRFMVRKPNIQMKKGWKQKSFHGLFCGSWVSLPTLCKALNNKPWLEKYCSFSDISREPQYCLFLGQFMASACPLFEIECVCLSSTVFKKRSWRQNFLLYCFFYTV